MFTDKGLRWMVKYRNGLIEADLARDLLAARRALRKLRTNITKRYPPQDFDDGAITNEDESALGTIDRALGSRPAAKAPAKGKARRG